MAKKKEFNGVVEESFNEGYNSEPTVEETNPVVPEEENPVVAEEDNIIEENLSENEILLRKIRAGEAETLEEVLGKEDRSTYYLTDVHRACIDIMSHEEGIKKNQVVVDALNKYFSDELKTAAKERVITMAIKKLEKEIAKENK